MTNENLQAPFAVYKGTPIFLSSNGEFTAHNNKGEYLAVGSLASMKKTLDKSPVKPTPVSVIAHGYFGLSVIEIAGEGIIPRKTTYSFKERQFQGSRASDGNFAVTGGRVAFRRGNDRLAEQDDALVKEHDEIRIRHDDEDRAMRERQAAEKNAILGRLKFLTDAEVMSRLYQKGDDGP